MGSVGFDEFFATEWPRLLRLSWLVSVDADASAEIVQETMARAWVRWDSISDGDPAAWCRTVVLNLCRDRARRRVVRDRVLPLLVNETVDQLDPSDPDLHRALLGLSLRQRQVVALRFWADLELAQIAEEIGIGVGSVKRHLYRALDRLRVELDDTGKVIGDASAG